MNKRRRYRVVLLLGLGCLVLAGAFGLRVRSYQRQEALNRQLITALLNKDTNKALQIVNQGADPNLPAGNGTTPLGMAQLCNHPDLVALLKQAGAKK